MKKKILALLFVAVAFIGGNTVGAANVEKEKIVDGNWEIFLIADDTQEHSWSFRVRQTISASLRRILFTNSCSQVNYDNAAGEARSVTMADFADYAWEKSEVNDDFGTGVCYTFTFTRPTNGDDVTMTQRFFLYEDADYLITDLAITGDASIRSNYLAPVSMQKSGYLFGSFDDGTYRMLKVPFDNDGFVRYHKYKMNTRTTSYEVGAMLSGSTGNGFVYGSIDHDRWKNAVSMDATPGRGGVKLSVYSGASDVRSSHSDSETRDVLPHGKIDGPTVHSARMFVGFFEDWREGMERFADANTKVAARNDSWTYGSPMGWQSWGVLAEKSSYKAVSEIAEYYAEVLRPGGFVNSQGWNVISLDASDGLNDKQRFQLTKAAQDRHQIIGSYGTPFSLWWSSNDFPRDYTTELNGVVYNQNDMVLKANGKHIWYDGAWARDPTHPLTKKDINSWFYNVASLGVKWVKLDFVNCGIIQADSYFDPNVKTAVEAYNQGMAYMLAQAKRYGIFVALSIAPVFPYQYANSRRIACDTWGRIGQTEYGMNSLSNGWWLGRLYQYNDPDHIVLVGEGDQEPSTLGENRARFTNGVVSGMVLVADNFSLNETSGRGNAEWSRARAVSIMMNKDVNEIADLGCSFRPVYGHKEFNGDGSAENFFVHETDQYLYAVVFNYNNGGDRYNPKNNHPMSGVLPLTDLGIGSQDFTEVRELWTNAKVTVKDGGLPYTVPSADVRIYRFTKVGGTGIAEVADDGKAGYAEVVPMKDYLMVYTEKDMSRVRVYNTSGGLLYDKEQDGRTQVEVPVPSAVKGIGLVVVSYSDGTSETCKTCFK